LTYPNATFYILEPGEPLKRGEGAGATSHGLPNHRHVPHLALSAPFPFPLGYFTAVIFRFPVASSDATYQGCIQECKRVLRPGGYFEVSVLDLDMMNMGNHMRRALRALKMNMNASNQEISLRNLGDMMMTLIGRRGFENMQRCCVGIPAAGRITRSQEITKKEEKRKSTASSTCRHEKDSDEDITTMVAKVGRWWYSTCYESSIDPTASIWARPGLLRECEKQGTSLRLLLCYAQKPTCPKRRTASV